MDLNELTIEQAKELAEMFGSNGGRDPLVHGAIGQKCIVRTYASGVHYGEVVSVRPNSGRSRCELRNSRRLWYWKTVKGISLSDLAMYGLNADKSKICTAVPTIYIEDAIEFIPASSDAIESIESAEMYNV